MPELYVVVCDNDQPHNIPGREKPFYDDGGPLIFEQYTKNADLESIKNRREQLQLQYGKCRIARLEFIDG